MARHRRVCARLRVEVMSPIAELSGESRCASRVVGSPESRNIDCQGVDSFRDHMVSLAEEYQKQMEQMGRQLREEREKNARLRQEVQHYRLDSYSYRLSWELDQAEIQALSDRIHRLEKAEREKTGVKLLTQEDGKHKGSTESLENIESMTTCHHFLHRHTVQRTNVQHENDKESPRMPSVQATFSDSLTIAQSRARTSKTRDVHLSLIKKHSGVDSSLGQTIRSSTSSKKWLPFTSLCSIPAAATVSKPPSLHSSSRRQSRIPLHANSTLRNVRRRGERNKIL